jgi:hypothetical protein
MGQVKGKGENNHTYEVYFKPFKGTEEKIYNEPEEELALYTCANAENKCGMITLVDMKTKDART